MNRVIIDTGPLVALLNARDQHHAWACDVLDGIEPPLLACEAVISEACFLVRRLTGGADAVLEMLARGVVEVPFRLDAELPAIRKLIAKYTMIPMSLADACLVRMTELDSQATILTVDADFRIYRRHGRQLVPVIMPS